MDDFLIRAALAGVGVSIAAGPLGALVIWRRMAQFGDATAHAAVLGVALALALQLPTGAGIFAVALAMGLAVSALMRQGHAGDATLAVLSQLALALGLVIAAALTGLRLDLSAFLFGDILTTSGGQVVAIWGGAALVLALLAWRWQHLLTATLSPELAISAGINPHREQAAFTLALALLVAMAVKVIGALLIAAILIIPAATARGLTRTPETMAALAAGLAALSALGGLGLSWRIDSPAGPSIIVVAGALYMTVALWRAIRPQPR